MLERDWAHILRTFKEKVLAHAASALAPRFEFAFECNRALQDTVRSRLCEFLRAEGFTVQVREGAQRARLLVRWTLGE